MQLTAGSTLLLRQVDTRGTPDGTIRRLYSRMHPTMTVQVMAAWSHRVIAREPATGTPFRLGHLAGNGDPRQERWPSNLSPTPALPGDSQRDIRTVLDTLNFHLTLDFCLGDSETPV